MCTDVLHRWRTNKSAREREWFKRERKKTPSKTSRTPNEANLCGFKNARLHLKMHNVAFILNKSKWEQTRRRWKWRRRKKKNCLPPTKPRKLLPSLPVANSILSKFLILWQHNLCAQHFSLRQAREKEMELKLGGSAAGASNCDQIARFNECNTPKKKRAQN